MRALIAAAQAVEHYEITRYGTLLAWAKQLGLSEAEGLIQETLIEEENTDEILSDLAEDAINPAAAALDLLWIGAVLRDGPSEQIAAQPLWPSHQAGPHPSRLMAHGRASDIEIRAVSDPKLAA